MLLKIKKKKLIYSIIISLILLIVFILVKEKVYALPVECYCVGAEAWCKTSCHEVLECSNTACDCTPLENGKYYQCCPIRDSSYDLECCIDNDCGPGCGSYATSSQGHGSITFTCEDNCGNTDSDTCYCWNACTPSSCPSSGTSETNTGDHYYTYSCSNSCGESQSRACYCNICDPPSCSTRGYFDSMQYDEWGNSQGQVPDNLTLSCRNGEGAPEQLSKCDMTYRTCYCPSCLKQCPIPLTNTNIVNPNLILNDFKECTNDCNVKPPEDQDDCYETESPQPTEELIKNIYSSTLNHYGFNSTTHTGDRLDGDLGTKLGFLNDPFVGALNNKRITMTAKYTDINGADDIEGMFVWFRGEQYTEEELGTPLYISETADPRASANDSWGFMLRRMGSSWQPYVPSYNGGNAFWTSTSGNIFSIDGTNGEKMVEVTIIGNPMQSGNTVSMEFSLRFSDDNGNLFPGNVSEGLYKIYLMGLDKFSFTPYDNYDIDYGNFWSKGFKYYGQTDLSPFWQDNQLRYKAEQEQLYARAWSYTEKTWTIDRTHPTLETSVTISGNSIILGWEASDDRSLYAIVGNIFTAGEYEKTITVRTSTGGVSLHNPATFKLNSEDNGVDLNKIGILNTMNVSLFQVNPNISSSQHSGSVTLDINHDAQDFLYFYITVFDDAGNIFQGEEIKQDLNDWMATAGGLAYSSGGTSFTVKDLDGVIWSGTLPPSSYEGNPGLIPPNVNLTSEMWGESDGLISFIPSSPLYSYSMKFTGIELGEDSYYTLLMDAYEKNKKNLGDNVTEKINIGIFSNAVSNYCSSEYCVFKYDSSSDVIINQGFACNKKTLMLINSDLIIQPPLKNSTSDTLSKINGCIFVVSGNVSILDGGDASNNNTSFKYDKVNGYILADGQIIIEDEESKRVPNTDPIIDGVYINGGLQSSKSNDGKSILFNRYLRLEDRLKFPLLAIDLHPKYGILGEKFFGSKYIIQTIELGVKP